MAPAEFKGLFRPSKTKYLKTFSPLSYLVKDTFTVPQLLCLGALGQTCLILLLPARYALLPVAVIFLHTVVTTAIQTIFPSRNIYFSDVVPARTTAQFPNPTYDPSRPAEKPLFGPNPASEQVVCFHIGMRYNHPLGPAAPGAKEMGQHIMKMFGAVHERAEEFGFLGMTSWRGGERDRLNTSLSVMYFRTLEGLHAFAHDKVHREGWDWYNKFTRETGYKHLGIYHETFVAPAGQWETVFDNMPPTLLGAANFPVRNEQTGEEEFVSPLVDGTVTKLRSQYGRMGKTSGGYQL